MAKQQGGEFASTDPTTRTQDAGFQERRFSAKISFLSCGSPQYVQRSTPSSFSKDAPSFGGRRASRRGQASSGLLATQGLDLLDMEEHLAQIIS
jgi:hypothetical protein